MGMKIMMMAPMIIDLKSYPQDVWPWFQEHMVDKHASALIILEVPNRGLFDAGTNDQANMRLHLINNSIRSNSNAQ